MDKQTNIIPCQYLVLRTYYCSKSNALLLVHTPFKKHIAMF